MLKYYVGYFLIMNIIAFFLMFSDKRRAQKGRWRIPERVLLGVGLLGGSLGGLLGMHLFRHKTSHLRFRLGFPLMLLLHIALTAALLFYQVL